MATNKAGKFTSVVNTKAVWIEDHLLRGADIVNDEPTVAGATVKAALAAISALITASTSAVQTLSNKSLVDASTFFVNSVDNTKKVRLDLSGFTAGLSRILTVPAFSGTVILGGNYNATNLSVGASSSAGGTSAVAVGPSAVAAGNESASFGNNASSSGAQSTAAGTLSNAIGAGSVAFGYGAAATQANGTALGAGAIALGDSTSTGYQARTNVGNAKACAYGALCTAQAVDACAYGYAASANFTGASVYGRGATAVANNQLVLRVGNSAVTELRSLLTTDATARATLVTHLPIELNGVTYYIKLYQT